MAGSKNLTIYIPSTGVLLTDFPFLITGAHMPQIFWDSVLSTGADIILYDSASNKLKRELVSIDTTNKTMELYVKCTRSATEPTLLTLNYCDPAGAETNDTDTWVNTFKMVQHMNDNPDTSTTQDSTVNNNDGTKLAANNPIEDTGVFGGDKSQTGDGTDYITTPLVDAADAASFTLSVAFKTTSLVDLETLFSEGNSGNNTPFLQLRYGSTGVLFYQRDDAATAVTLQKAVGFVVVNDGAWHIATIVKSGNVRSLYVDGDFQTTDTTALGATTVDLSTLMALGRVAYLRQVDATVSEFRLALSNFSADWIAAEYQNLLNNAATYHVVTPNVPRIARLMLAMHG